jgi:tetratricopeptide (TPR) repeat protein
VRATLFLAATICAATAASAEPRWTMVRSESMTLIGDQSAGALRDIALELEQFRAVLGRLSPNGQPAPTAPTMVYVFGSRKAFEPFLPMHNGRRAAVGGYFQRGVDANTIALSPDGFLDDAPVVFHEYSHLLVGTMLRSVPIWLNEGLAEYFSTFRLTPGGKDALIGVPIKAHVQLLFEGFIPLREVLAVDQNSALYNEGARRSIFYAESWALVHYLMTEVPSGQALINRYTGAIAGGATSEQAFATSFGMTPAAFEPRLQEYIHRRVMNSWIFPIGERIKAAPPPARVLSHGEAEAWLGDLQLRIQRNGEAAKRIEGAVGGEPDAAAAQLALARLRLSQDRSDEAWPALERAARLAPDDFDIQYGAGAASLQYLESAAAGTRADLEQRAHDALTRAAMLAPNSPDAFGWLAYAEMRRRAWTEAAKAVGRAIELAPGRTEFRLRQADIMILRGAPHVARPMLQEIARSVDRISAEAARRRLDALDAAGVPGGAATSSPAAAAPPPATVEPRGPLPRMRLDLRPVRDGEERAFGRLSAVECTGGRVLLHVEVGGRDLVTAVARFADVDLVRFTENKEATLGCGGRVRADPVYVTWRAAKPNGWPGEIAGVAVALEFLPLDFVP